MTELTDLEICTRIAEIEGLIISNHKVAENDLWVHIGHNEDSSVTLLDPLTDKALCFDLMVKERLQLLQLNNGDYIAFKQRVFVNVNNCTKGVSSPQRALCLEVIRQHESNTQANKEQ